MADRFPLILNTSINQIQEIASGDNLDLTGTGISNAGIITAGNVTIGAATTDLVVTGDARITGILTIGTSSLKLDGTNNLVNVGTALTLGHTQGLQFHTQNLHSAGFEVNQINVSGITTVGGKLDTNGVIEAIAGENKIPFLYADMAALPNAGTYHGMFAHVHSEGKGYFAHAGAWYELVNKDTNGNVALNKDLDVDGHTNLDNVSIAGVTTSNGTLTISNAAPNILFTDTDHNPDFGILASGGMFRIQDQTNSNNLMTLDSSKIQAVVNLDALAGLDVTGNATVSGNLTVGGVLSYEDVTNVDSVGIVTARSGVHLPDTKEVRLGGNFASSDARIYHNGADLYIDNDTGGTWIGVDSGSTFGVGNGPAASPRSLRAVTGAQVDLYYNHNIKFTTTDTGSVVTGILTANTLSAGGLRLTDDGAESPVLSVMADDGSPWAFQVGNSSYNTSRNFGSMMYTSNSGVGYFTHYGNSEYNDFQFSLHNGTSNHRTITFEAADQSVKLYCGNNPQLQTQTSGISLAQTTSRLLWPQNGNSNSRSWGWIGEDGAYGIFELKHSDTNDTVTDKKSIRAYSEGPVYLYHNDQLKLQTSSSGATVTGTLTANNSGYGSGSSNIEVQPYGQRGYINFTGTNTFYFRTGSSYATRWTIDSNGHFSPGADNTYDFGSTALRWRNIYTNDLNLSNKGKTNDVDNTWGDYTIQEGESDLFLINNRSGKKYKFNLTEVS